AEALKGHLDGLLLAVVASAPAHGYGVISELRDRSGGEFDLPEGTVYPALHRLEKAGLLTSSWSQDAPRRRRVYAITPAGERSLGQRRAAWRGFTSAIDAVMGRTA
ncbi:MAG: PadR family transcriptional regulator, regulatory protein PadR, partial [Solirubrobacteraceae bacterium]|nr:PadR family transcriptional regulator, regulatory protein PadR [Solirubrobacteraceae bacterium]